MSELALHYAGIDEKDFTFKKSADKKKQNSQKEAEITEEAEVSREIDFYLQQIDDEWEKPPSTLEVLSPVLVKEKEFFSEKEKDVDISDKIAQAINDQFIANKIETNSEATRFLTDLGQRMIEGTELSQLRVFIIKKGETINASAFPDGTIFFTQALLNCLDTVDEIGAVLAHEIGHLLNKTTVSTYGSENSIGLGWAHEMASDITSQSLLEKVGLNSGALVSALKKIDAKGTKDDTSRNKRDIVHQSAQARAFEFKLVTQKLDSHTSDIDQTPKEQYDFLRSAEIQPTNFEILKKTIDLRSEALMTRVLEKMSAEDLVKTNRFLSESLSKKIEEEQGFYEETQIYYDLESAFILQTKKSLDQLLQRRLVAELDIDESVAKAIFLINGTSREFNDKGLRELQLFNSFEEVLQGLDDLSFWDNFFKQKRNFSPSLQKLLFQPSSYHYINKAPRAQYQEIFFDPKRCLVAGMLNSSFYSLERQSPEEGTFFIDPKKFFILFDRISNELNEDIKKHLIASFFFFYFYSNSLENRAKIFSYEEQKDFFTGLKARGIKFNFIKERTDSGEKGLEFVESFFSSNTIEAWRLAYGESAEQDNEDEGIEKLFQDFIDQLSFLGGQKNSGSSKSSPKGFTRQLSDFTEKVQNLRVKRDISDESWEKIITVLKEKLTALHLPARDRILDHENFFRPVGLKHQIENESVQQENQKVFEFKTALYIFTVLDCREKNQQTSRLAKFLAESDLNFETYDWKQLIYLLQGIWAKKFQMRTFLQSELGSEGTLPPFGFSGNYDFTQLESLLPIKILLEKIDQAFVPAENLEKFLVLIKEKKDFLNNFYLPNSPHISPDDENLFDDSWHEIYFWKNERENLLSLIQNLDLSKEKATDFPTIINLITEILPNDASLSEVKNKLTLAYLRQKEIPFDQRADFFFQQTDSELEGVEILASEIDDLAVYKNFKSKIDAYRKRWQKEKKDLSLIALADFFSSFFKDQIKVFQTAIPEQKFIKEQNNQLLLRWLELYDDRFDQKTEKFFFKREGGLQIRSLADIYITLNNLSAKERGLLINKLLNDTNGSLTSQERRFQLAKIVDQVINLDQDQFITQMVTILVGKGKAESISLPLLALFQPLIFKNLQTENLQASRFLNDIREQTVTEIQTKRKLTKKEAETVIKQELIEPLLSSEKSLINETALSFDPEYSERQDLARKIDYIANSSTRDITFFGPDYIHQPESRAALLAQESNEAYHFIFQTLLAKIKLLEETAEREPEAEKVVENQQIEAIVGSLEAGGAVMVRQLQLATQFVKFDSAWQKRLSRTLDSNPGLSKLEAWQNLYHWTIEVKPENEQEKKEQLELQELFQHYRLGQKVGGGSLNTIFELIPLNPESHPPAVIRIQNPNVAANVMDMSQTLAEAYDALKENPSLKKEARIGAMINDLSRKWCLSDIRDPRFLDDDNQFRLVLAAFRPSDEGAVVSAPELGLTQAKVKVEQLAPGETLNKLLTSPDISEEDKNRLRKTFCELFLHQLDFEKNKVVNSQGREEIIVHSDQHLGNYMAEILPDGSINFSVIDRNMYLHLEADDVQVIKTLLSEKGGGLEFVRKLVDRVLDINKILNPVDRKKTQDQIRKKLILNGVKNIFHRRQGDDLEQLQIIFEQLALQNYEIPLNLQLMIRNTTAYKNIKAELDRAEKD